MLQQFFSSNNSGRTGSDNDAINHGAINDNLIPDDQLPLKIQHKTKYLFNKLVHQINTCADKLFIRLKDHGIIKEQDLISYIEKANK